MTPEELAALREAKPSWVGKAPLVVRPPATRPTGWPVIANEIPTPPASQQFLPDYRGDSENIQELNYDAGTSSAFVDTWDRTTGLGVSWKGTRVYEVDSSTFTLIQTVSKSTTSVVSSISTSTASVAQIDVTERDLWLYDEESNGWEVATYFNADAHGGGTHYSKLVATSIGCDRDTFTPGTGGGSLTAHDFQLCGTSGDVWLVASAGVVVPSYATGTGVITTFCIDDHSDVDVIYSVTPSNTTVVSNVTTTTKTLKVISRFEFSRERVYDSNGALYSISAEFLVRQTSYLTEG